MEFLRSIPEEGYMFFFLGASSLFKAAMLTRMEDAPHKQRRHVGTVTKLRLYPFKSARPIDVQELGCQYEGMHSGDMWDRTWMAATSDYTFVTARQEPRLVLIQPSSTDGTSLTLTAPGMTTLTLPVYVNGSPTNTKVFTKVHGQRVEGVDCGDEAGAWLSKFLARPGLRLLYSPQWLDKRFVNNGPSRYHKRAQDKDKVAFADMCASSLMNETSLADLASKLPVPVGELNFRANIIMDGCQAYDEDHFLEVHIGSAVFRRIKQTDRCLLTTVNPDTGTKYQNEEPLHSMRGFRMLPGYATPCFCLSLVVEQQGTVRVGDDIYAIYG